MNSSRNIFFICLVTLWPACAVAHPLSYTDAWVKVSKTVDVRLNVSLDDVLRYHGCLPDPDSTVPQSVVAEAVAVHGQLLLKQLRIFRDQGVPLVGTVTSSPEWEFDGEAVSLSVANSLKLTWQIQFRSDSEQPIRELLFLHDFTHESLDETGELRLRLQDTSSGRRIDAVIPARQPHTILLPIPGERVESGEQFLNQLTSRMVLGPTHVSVELSGPILLMDSAFPALTQLKNEISFAGEDFSGPVWNSSEQDQAELTFCRWARQNLVVEINGTPVDPESCVIEFFPLTAETESGLDEQSPSELVPLVGTAVGIRLSYLRGISVSRVVLKVKQSPGPFAEVNVSVSSFFERYSTLKSLSDDPEVGNSFEFEWILQQVRPDSAPTSRSVDPEHVISQKKTYPGVVGGMAIVFVMLAFFALWMLSTVKRTMLLSGLSMICVVVVATQFPDHSYKADLGQVAEVVQGKLSCIYEALQQNDEQLRMSSLNEVLEDDVLEEIYLGALRSLSSQADEPLSLIRSIDVEKCVASKVANTRELVANCQWTVDAVVEHWGHSHDRRLLLTGDVGLLFDGERWKIRSFQATAVPSTP